VPGALREEIAMSRIAIAVCLFAALAADDTATVQVIIAAGATARSQVPVRVLVAVPEALAMATAATLRGDGGEVAGQLGAPGLDASVPAAVPGKTWRELNAVIPALAAKATATYAVTIGGAAAVGGFRWMDGDGQIDLRHGERPVLRYQCAKLDESTPARREETFKVFHHVFAPDGSRLLSKGPGGKFTHHRGIFYGFAKVTYQGKTVDIWHCKGAVHQAHGGVLLAEAGPVLARQRLLVEWRDGATVFAKEERELTAWSLPGGTLIEFASRLLSTKGPVKVDGDPQHAGFHFRADNEVDAKTSKETIYVRPDGVGAKGEARNSAKEVDFPWKACSFVLADARYTVAYLAHPGNPKPAMYSEREYGRFGSYFVATCDEQKPISVRWRLWVQAGEMTVEQVAGRHGDFATPPVVTVP